MNKKLTYLRETIAIALVAVACRGELLAANSTTLSLTMVPNVSITGDIGNYTLQYANVVGGGQTNWVTLATNITLSGATKNWLDYSGVGQAQRFYRTLVITNSVPTNNPNPSLLVWIPDGTFLMGSPDSEVYGGALNIQKDSIR